MPKVTVVLAPFSCLESRATMRSLFQKRIWALSLVTTQLNLLADAFPEAYGLKSYTLQENGREDLSPFFFSGHSLEMTLTLG